MINVSDKLNCCGCSACASACPKKCISMRSDEEGFLYPVVEMERCSNCNLCECVCPVLNVTEKKCEQHAYLVQIKDEVVRRESTSGGAFTAIAQYVIWQGGVVFGAAFNKKFEVAHKYVENKENLREFRNSKYVQSRIGDTYIQVKSFLDAQRLVCFSGTPCQIEGLKCFLRKEYENLITVDVVCRAVPSPLLWNKYLDMQKKIYQINIDRIMFREKYYGYKYSTMSIYSSEKIEESAYHMGVESDPMLRAFFSNICDRPSCYQCSFKKRYRVSDFTLWDCFSVDKFNKQMDDDKGTTRVLLHSIKAIKIFQEFKENINYSNVDVESIVSGVNEMFFSVPLNSKRTDFFADMKKMDGKQLFEKYYPATLKVKLEKAARLTSHKLGIYKPMKRLWKSIVE